MCNLDCCCQRMRPRMQWCRTSHRSSKSSRSTSIQQRPRRNSKYNCRRSVSWLAPSCYQFHFQNHSRSVNAWYGYEEIHGETVKYIWINRVCGRLTRFCCWKHTYLICLLLLVVMWTIVLLNEVSLGRSSMVLWPNYRQWLDFLIAAVLERFLQSLFVSSL